MINFIQIPKFCPYCNIKLIIKKDNNSEVLFCPNEQCESRLINILDHFFGKKGLDIKGISKATFEKLIEWNWVENIRDTFFLSKYKKEWIKKPGFGIKSVDNILKSIEEGKNTTLDKFISALGIPLIGQTAAKDLAKHFETYEDFRDAVIDNDYNFFILDNFGEEMNNNIKNFDYTEADEISKILIVKPYVVSNNKVNNTLEDKTIVITGKLTTVKNRAELKSIIESHGGKVTGSITSKTDLLINNDVDSTSSKNKTAKERGIPIISEIDFIQKYIEN